MSASETPNPVPVKPKTKQASKSTAGTYGTPFYISRFLFLAGLAFVTFEEVRPAGGIMLSDFLFGLSILFLPRARWTRLPKAVKYSFMVAPGLILLGAILSLQSPGRFVDGAGALLKLFTL